MEKKVTVKDVAKEAGVSVATVSYIMNNRTDMKISEETKKKVLQIANLLNYMPSSAAKSLATGRNNIIGVSYSLNDSSPSRNLEITAFVNLIIERLNRQGYNALFMPINKDNTNIQYPRNIDGIIAIDLAEDEFKELADNSFVPIIAIDMIINDNLFYQVYPDYLPAINNIMNSIKDNNKSSDKNNDVLLVIEDCRNNNFLNYLSSSVKKENTCIVSNINSELINKLKNKKLIVIGAYLALMLRPYVKEKDMTVIATNSYSHMIPDSINLVEDDAEKKANVAINLLLNAMDRKFEVAHDHKIPVLNTIK